MTRVSLHSQAPYRDSKLTQLLMDRCFTVACFTVACFTVACFIHFVLTSVCCFDPARILQNPFAALMFYDVNIFHNVRMFYNHYSLYNFQAFCVTTHSFASAASVARP
jgi:hypothetical protein